MSNLAVVLLFVAIVAILVAISLYVRLQRERRLKQKFGPEYERAVRELGDGRRAQADLQAREKRVAHYSIRRLTPEESAGFAAQWQGVQAEFVDNPDKALTEADHLIDQALGRSGYPVGDFERQAADLSVEHAAVVEHYRMAHSIAKTTRPSTEELRVAMQHYRKLFEDLVGQRA